MQTELCHEEVEDGWSHILKSILMAVCSLATFPDSMNDDSIYQIMDQLVVPKIHKIVTL